MSAYDLYFSSDSMGGLGSSAWDLFSFGSFSSASFSSSAGGEEEGPFFEPASQAPKADPTEPRRMLDDVESPAAPEEGTEGEHRNIQWPEALNRIPPSRSEAQEPGSLL